jgi:hypothetical protein
VCLTEQGCALYDRMCTSPDPFADEDYESLRRMSISPPIPTAISRPLQTEIVPVNGTQTDN